MSISKIHGPWPHRGHSFLYRITTFGITTSRYLFHHETDFMKSRIRQAYTAKIFICENNYSRWLFSQNVPSKMFDRVMNMPQILNMPALWIYRGSEYTRVVNMPGFWIFLWYWICQGSGYIMVLCQGYSWLQICLNMPE